MSPTHKTIGVIGAPAGSMSSSGFSAGRTAAGTQGEHLSAEILAGFRARALIVHDLALPIKLATNIDHLLVAESAVLAIDSKCFLPGRYTGHPSSLRGPSGQAKDVTTMNDAVEALVRMLAEDGFDVDSDSLVAIHPSTSTRRGAITVSRGLRGLFTRSNPMIIAGDSLGQHVDGWLSGRRPAEPNLAEAVARIQKRGARR